MRGALMDDGQPQKLRRNGVWKLAVGLLLVFASVNNWLTSDRDVPAVLQYSNETQRIAGNVTQFLILLLGVGLILAWVFPAWLKRKRSNISVAGTESPKDHEKD
jgi:hypothetical protein